MVRAPASHDTRVGSRLKSWLGSAAHAMVVRDRVVRGHRHLLGPRCALRRAFPHRFARDALRHVGRCPRADRVRLPFGEHSGTTTPCPPLSPALRWDRRHRPDRARGSVPIAGRPRAALRQGIQRHGPLVSARRSCGTDAVDRLRRMARPAGRGRRVAAGSGTRSSGLGACDPRRRGVPAARVDVRAELLPPPGPRCDGPRPLRHGMRLPRTLGRRRRPRRPRAAGAAVRAPGRGAPARARSRQSQGTRIAGSRPRRPVRSWSFPSWRSPRVTPSHPSRSEPAATIPSAGPCSGTCTSPVHQQCCSPGSRPLPSPSPCRGGSYDVSGPLHWSPPT